MGQCTAGDGFTVGKEEQGISGCTARRREKVFKHVVGEGGKRDMEMKTIV